jgi:hypothetical protein
MICGTNSEDKNAYCEQSSKITEPLFVERFGVGGILNLPIIINPKKKENKFVLDLLNTSNGNEMDVKVEETPFYTAYKYKVSPQYAYTINVYDIDSYIKKYKDVGIFVWLNFKDNTREFGVNIYQMEGVYYTTALKIENMPNKKIRTIERRINDKNGNKPDSYVLDVRDLICLYFCRPSSTNKK